MGSEVVIAVIAVLGTLAGVIVSTIGTQVIQSRTAEREEEREKIRIRRELVSNRLKIVEEAADIMMFLIGVGLDETMGLKAHCEPDMMLQKRKRIEEIFHQARTAVGAVKSDELSASFSRMVSQFWECESEGPVVPQDYDIVSVAYGEVAGIIDEIKIGV